MPNEAGCTTFGGGPVMKTHWKRMWWNMRHVLWDFKNGNPHHHKHRKAYSDITHSWINIPVEYCRACPYRAGHLYFYMTIALVVLAVASVVAHL